MPNKGPIVTHYHLVDPEGKPIPVPFLPEAPDRPIKVDIGDVHVNFKDGTLDITLIYPARD